MNKNISKQKITGKNENSKINGAFIFSENFSRILVFIVPLLLYMSTVTFDFTLDDSLMITQNEFTKKGLSGVKEIFTNDAFTGFFGKNKELVAGGRYRPLTHAMFAVEYQLFGAKAWIGHTMNIMFYALLCLVIYITLSYTMQSNTVEKKWTNHIPLLATLLFAVHPLHSEVVCNIKGRDEIISMGGSMLALLFSLKYIDIKRPQFLLYSFVAFLFGIFSKENTITFLAVIPLCVYFFRKADLKDYFVILLPVVVGTVVFLIARYEALGFLMKTPQQTEILNNPFIGSSKSDELATVFYTWLLYFKLMIFPHPLTHDYYPWHLTVLSFSNYKVILSLLVNAFLSIVALKNFAKRNIISFSILFFFITFSIQSNLLFNIGTFMNERFVFVALLGFCIVLAYFLKNYEKYLFPKVLFITLFLLFSIKTVTRSQAWKDNFTLFTTDVQTSSNSAKVNVSAGEVLIAKAKSEQNKAKAQQMFSQALQYLLKAQNIHPTYFGAYDLAGVASFYVEDYNSSFRYYQKCLQINPQNKIPFNNLLLVAKASSNSGKDEDALSMLQWLISYAPDSLQFRFELALVYEKQKKYSLCLDALSEILNKNNNYAPAYTKTGEIYGKYLNDLSKAENYLLKAREINPKDFSTNEDLGVVYGLMQQFESSVKYFSYALEIDSTVARLHTNIANSYLKLNDKPKAEFHFQKAKKIEQLK